MNDIELLEWVEEQFKKTGYSRELCRDGNEWFVSANKEIQSFILTFDGSKPPAAKSKK